MKIQKDKILHFAVGAGFGVMTYFIPAFLLIAVLVFILKEVFDMYKPNPTGFSFGDLLADVVGFAFGFSLIYLIFN